MERNYAIDYLKFFAIFAVVLIHTGPFSNVALLGIDGYYIDFAIDTLSRFSVPFFFITSGFLFGKKIMSGKNGSEYFSGYLYKLGKLFASWFIFYLLYDLIVKTLFQSFDIFSAAELIRYISDNVTKDVFLYGKSSGYQLWYLVALMWSVLILFIFIHLNKLNALLFISFGLNLIGLFGQSYSGILSLPFDTRDALYFGLFYTTLGAYIANQEERIKQKAKKGRVYLTSFIILSFLLLAERGLTVFIYEGKIGDYFILTIPITLSLFLFAIMRPELGKGSFLTKVGSNAVGIYVIHVFLIKFIRLLVDVSGLGTAEETIIWNLLFSPVVFILSYISYTTLQHVKGRVTEIRKKCTFI
jgi:surface polysaccharide O-acyltransferase-like enzyme